MAQVDDLAARVPQAEVLKLADCAHSPHRDRPEAVTQATLEFVARHAKISHRSFHSNDRRGHHEAK
jgi:hypothetical protein